MWLMKMNIPFYRQDNFQCMVPYNSWLWKATRVNGISPHFKQWTMRNKETPKIFNYVMFLGRNVRRYSGLCFQMRPMSEEENKQITDGISRPASNTCPKKVWGQVGIDIMTMKKVGEYRYLITGMDYFSQNIKMHVLKTKSAKEVAQFIYEDIICRCGSLDVIITDQGSEFCNTKNDKLMEHAYCKHQITSSYHYQSNRLDKWQNRTMTIFLLKNIARTTGWTRFQWWWVATDIWCTQQ